jgi:superfamily II DNA helicase RecQ
MDLGIPALSLSTN